MLWILDAYFSEIIQLWLVFPFLIFRFYIDIAESCEIITILAFSASKFIEINTRFIIIWCLCELFAKNNKFTNYLLVICLTFYFLK